MAKAALLDAQGMEEAFNAMAETNGIPPDCVTCVVGDPDICTVPGTDDCKQRRASVYLPYTPKAIPGNHNAIPTAYGKPDGEKPKDFFKQLDEIDETIAEGEGKKYDCVTCPVQNKDQCTAPGSDDCKARLAQVAGASVGPSLGGSEASKPG